MCPSILCSPLRKMNFGWFPAASVIGFVCFLTAYVKAVDGTTMLKEWWRIPGPITVSTVRPESMKFRV